MLKTLKSDFLHTVPSYGSSKTSFNFRKFEQTTAENLLGKLSKLFFDENCENVSGTFREILGGFYDSNPKNSTFVRTLWEIVFVKVSANAQENR